MERVAAARLRAFEDEVLGKDAVRINGHIERGVGSHYQNPKKMTAEQRARLDKVSAPPLLYPYWHQVQTAHDRLGGPDLSLLGPHLKA